LKYTEFCSEREQHADFSTFIISLKNLWPDIWPKFPLQGVGLSEHIQTFFRSLFPARWRCETEKA